MHCLHWQGEHESRAHKEDSTREFLAGAHYLGLSENGIHSLLNELLKENASRGHK
jgi:hypothetical protein